jgi:cell division protein ZapB
MSPPSTLEQLVERVDRLLLRHEELKRAHALLEHELGAVTSERDSLRARLTAARGRIDALLARLPEGADADVDPAGGAAAR